MKTLIDDISNLSASTVYGRVSTVRGLLVEVSGPIQAMAIGSRIDIASNVGKIPCEVVGIDDGVARCMPFQSVEGVALNDLAVVQPAGSRIRPDRTWLGRIINGLGQPIDGKGPLLPGATARQVRAEPPDPHTRQRVGAPMDMGVRSLNTFVTICEGQRMGIFAGSGVGKSVLFSMLAKNADCDVAVIGLVGERGREVQEFIHDALGEVGLKRAIVVVATSSDAAVMRRQAALTTMAIAEYFRDEGQRVLCLMDSVTRFAMAQREIGLAGGEPPTTRGYTPTVFSELPRLLERAGPGPTGSGCITGIFTVLVEGDDHNEPVADAVRGILDGHIVMERAIAERGRYPAINVLKSISRTMPNCVPEHRRPIIREARSVLAAYDDMEELIRIGAYRQGADPLTDRAISLQPAFDAFLGQDPEETASMEEGYDGLAAILSGGPSFANQGERQSVSEGGNA
ncbi:MAG: flagellar protein export ATPase FliI [Pseudomonadota bacterium]